jgi:hypothetical protein
MFYSQFAILGLLSSVSMLYDTDSDPSLNITVLYYVTRKDSPFYWTTYLFAEEDFEQPDELKIVFVPNGQEENFVVSPEDVGLVVVRSSYRVYKVRATGKIAGKIFLCCGKEVVGPITTKSRVPEYPSDDTVIAATGSSDLPFQFPMSIDGVEIGTWTI